MSWIPLLVLSSAMFGQAPATEPARESPPPQAKKKADEKPSTKLASRDQKPVKKPAPLKKMGPQVLTRSERQRQSQSPFLRPPGSEESPDDRYGLSPDAIDWRDIPAWRQASFFGIRAQGRFFVYVIDCSESMIDEDRFARATMEVRRSVMALQAPQQFEVIFYNEDPTPMPGGPMPRPADATSKNQLRSWIRLVEPDGGTDPRGALRQALALRPEAVFLLSDGAFPDGTAEYIAQFNAHRIPIHCVDLSGGEGGDHLRRIARESGGRYASRPGNLQGKR